MAPQESKHISVLMDEVISYMDVNGDEIVVDGTINGGGHSLEIAKRLSKEGTLVGIDLDESALAISEKKLKGLKPKIFLVRGNFRNIDSILRELDIDNVDRILFDLGWSSNQFEDGKRGFSFQKDGPLQMVLSSRKEDVPFTAWNIINEWEEEQIAQILYSYGDEKFSRRIAKKIVEKRKDSSIDTTLELASLVSEAIPARFRKKGIHPATKTFQALRIAVNDEISALEEGLEKSFHLLSPKGRLLVITFHSLEDRIVKNFMRKKKKEGLASLVEKKGVVAGREELSKNPRSRSARLRILEKK